MSVRFYLVWVICIFMLSFALRMADMPHGLPYIDHPDEPNFYALANDVRGVRDAFWRNDWLDGYPPGYIELYALVLNGIDAISENNIHTDMGMYVGILRITSILIDMLTLSLIMLAARWLSNPLASLLAGGIWAISAAVVQNAILALPDPPTVFACVLCVVFTLKAFRNDAFIWMILATLAGLLATLFKYPVAPILLLPAAFCLWQLWHDFRRALLPCAIALALVLLTVYGLFGVYGANDLNNVEADTVRSGFFTNLLEPFRWYKVFNGLLGTFGVGLLVVLGTAVLSGVQAYRKNKKQGFDLSSLPVPSPLRPHPPTPSLRSGEGEQESPPCATGRGEGWGNVYHLTILTAFTGFLILAVIPGYLHSYANSIYPIRYTLPAAAVLLIAVAAFIGQLLFSKNQDALAQKISRSWMMLAWGVPIIALVPETIAYQTFMQRPFTYTAMQYWFEENIPENSLIWTTHIDPYVSLARYDRGYSGFKNFNVVFAPNNVAENGLTTADMDYLYLSEEDLRLFQNTDLPLVKHIGGTPYREPDLYIYLAHALPNPQKTVFANSTTQLLLRGIRAENSTEQIIVESYWQAPTLPDKIYSYSLYLSPTADPAQPLAQMDGQLGHRATNTWIDPEELLRGDLQPLALPELAPGNYSVWLVLYSWETGERFILPDGTDHLEILSFLIPNHSD